ncbi:MAG: M28 family peptidase [Dehalococcoidales bacterium]|nr:M28 family peptidase [Dehalococcoidales bacterium]
MNSDSSGTSSAATEIKEMIQDLCDLSGYGVHSGINIGEKGETAVRYILEQLRSAGIHDAKPEPIQVHSPFPDMYEVTVEENGKEVMMTESCSPLHWTAGTPEAGIAGELVYVGTGTASDFQLNDVEGKIALIDEKFMRGYMATAKEATVTAINNGAIAVFRANMLVDSPQQQKGEGSPTNIIPIPVFCFSKSGGDYLRNLAVSGTPHTVKLKLEVKHQVCDAHNIVFELPGNGSSEEVILVGTHYDTGYYTGAVDNNGSVALLIKWAEYFASKPVETRNRDMIFAWCLGHDFDMNAGHYQFAEAHKDRLEKAIVWDVDHAAGGTRYVFDETEGKIVPVVGETCEFYIISNNYVFTRLAAFTMDKYGFTCTQNRFGSFGSGPQWGIAPLECPWVNVASIPLYYHSTLDTPDKITLDQVRRAYSAHIEIIENIDNLPNGFLFYDNVSKTRPNTPPRVSISVVTDKVRVGDTVSVWNDETRFYDDKTSYHYPALPEWAGTTWDWGDESPVTIGGPTASHVYEKPGTYTVTMVFTDTEGASATAVKHITVLPMPDA